MGAKVSLKSGFFRLFRLKCHHLDLNQGHFDGYTLDDHKSHYRLCGRPANSEAHMSNLLLTMAQKMGVETERFGDSNHTLDLG